MKIKILFSIIFFIFLVYGTYWWLSTQLKFDFTQLLLIDKKLFFIGAMLSFFLFITDAFRYMTLIQSMKEKITFLYALEAGIINFFFAWTTPGAVFAAPMASFFLVRRGCSLGVSLLASLGKSILGLIFLLFFTLAVFFLSGIHDSFEKKVYIPIYLGLLNYFLLMVVVLLFAFFPWKRSFLPKKIILMIDKIRPLLKDMNKQDFFNITISQIIYFVLLIFFTALLINPFLSISSLVNAIALSSVFLSLIYLSPTPGGVGIGELVGIPILGRFMPTQIAITVTILVRLFVVYVPIGLGALYLFIYALISYQKGKD